LPSPISLSAEVEGLLSLINHFDPSTELEDRLSSKSLLYALDLGLKDWTYRLESVRNLRSNNTFLILL
jgi:hypothetical protein